MIKTRVIRLRVIEDPNARDQITFCVFNTFIEEVQTNAGYIHATRDACVITTWRLGLRAPLVARKKVQIQKKWVVTPTWPPFRCFGTPIDPNMAHMTSC